MVNIPSWVSKSATLQYQINTERLDIKFEALKRQSFNTPSLAG
jgi:hypothetical protein